MINGQTSFWLHQLGANRPTRAALPGDRDVDVAIVGAGFTGLWTAYWLTLARPGLNVAIVESRHVGYGASGRNGGWLSGKMVGLRSKLAAGPRGREAVLDLQSACFEAIDEVLAVMADNGHDVDAVKGGYLQVARTPAELARLHEAHDTDLSWGLTEADSGFVDHRELAGRVHVEGALGGLYSPHSARLNPAKLVAALASIVETAGVVIYEDTPATSIASGAVQTARGQLRASIVLRATEGYTASLPGGWRELLPVNSSMVATEPLSDTDWKLIGWDGHEGLSSASHRYFYAQRTADNRIALGGRGLPYRFGSRLDRDGKLDRWTISQLKSIVTSLFPGCPDIEFAHAWCGLLGVPRDWSPSVQFEPASGLGVAGGYVGQGVTASYLAARTLADLVVGEDSRFTNLPWTQRKWPRWEPEPLRFAGAYGVYGLYNVADTIENRRRAPATSSLAKLADSVSGRR